MSRRSFSGLAFLGWLLVSNPGLARVYKNIQVGEFKAKFDISDCENKTLLSYMKSTIYPAMEAEAANRSNRPHIEGVKSGEGVELRLTRDVTTYHVRYKAASEENAERSGRSFGAVGKKGKVFEYVADASDAYYLDSLSKVSRDEAQLEAFYETILGIIAKCDASGFSNLDTAAKRVAADFVAVYVAEEYRHLIGGQGDLGDSFNWDDALLQVTLLASFHSGQPGHAMFYEGAFTDEVYDQKYEVGKEEYCVYKQYRHPKRSELEKRAAVLRDYWQFNRTCDRSGINMTRSDFTRMAKKISEWMAANREELTAELREQLGTDSSDNVYRTISTYFINNETPSDLEDSADDLVGKIVAYLMEVRESAPEITDGI